MYDDGAGGVMPDGGSAAAKSSGTDLAGDTAHDALVFGPGLAEARPAGAKFATASNGDMAPVAFLLTPGLPEAIPAPTTHVASSHVRPAEEPDRDG